MKPSPQLQRAREKLHRAKYGRWWWWFYFRLNTRVPWILVAVLSALSTLLILKSL